MRQALIEARRSGIHSFCITIDTEARDYLPHMYGPQAATESVGYLPALNHVRQTPTDVNGYFLVVEFRSCMTLF